MLVGVGSVGVLWLQATARAATAVDLVRAIHRITHCVRLVTAPMPWLILGLAAAFTALAHTAPFPFALDALHADRVIWRMPHGLAIPPTIHLTYDDGPNPTATPALLMARGLRACPPPSS